MTEQTAPPADPTPTDSEPTIREEDQTGYMVYDKTLRRFVGRKSDTKSAAEKTVTKVRGHKYETRAV